MPAAGFVLVGGRSSRMGADKALLPYRGGTLAGHVAGEVAVACGGATFIGDRDRYGHLGFPVIADRMPGNGPLGGIAAAVAAVPDWALVVACDMPGVEPAFLRRLIAAAETARAGTECVVPQSEGGLEPLCAVYHRGSLPLLDSFLDHKFLKMRDVVGSMQALVVPFEGPWFRNINTPEDLAAS